jgi:hypothetical protein
MRSPRDPLPSRHDGPAVVAESLARRTACAFALGLAALIHLLPLPGLLGAQALQALYGIEIVDPGLLLLLRHRALLFGLLGIGLLLSIPRREWRAPMLVAGIASTAAFLLLALDGPAPGPELQRVVRVDVVAFGALVLAALLGRRRDIAPDRR